MTLKTVGTEYIVFNGRGSWIDFCSLTCDFCDTRFPADGNACEVGEVAEHVFFTGWSRIAGLDECPACILRGRLEAAG